MKLTFSVHHVHETETVRVSCFTRSAVLADSAMTSSIVVYDKTRCWRTLVSVRLSGNMIVGWFGGRTTWPKS